MIKRSIKKLLPKNVLQTDKLPFNIVEKFFFIHIPKTAGSSFRHGFENSYLTLKDYGNGSKNTSKEIQTNLYDNNDIYQLKKEFNSLPCAWLTGHVNLAKYIDFVPMTHTISFVREPLEQVLSHYNHYLKHHDFKGDISDFLEKPFSKNLQSKCLASFPLGLVGNLGITEHYNDSLSLINEQFNLNLPIIKVNVNKTKQVLTHELSETVKDKIINNNQRDIDLYQEALFLHQQRFRLFNENKQWVHGYASINQNRMLNGCVYQYQNEEAFDITVKVNNVVLKTVVANGFFGGYVKANFPRERYIGFHIKLPNDLTHEDEIDVYVEKTGQKLNYKALKIV